MNALDEAAIDSMAANDRGLEDTLAEWLYWSLLALNPNEGPKARECWAENAKQYRDAFLAGTGTQFTRY